MTLMWRQLWELWQPRFPCELGLANRNFPEQLGGQTDMEEVLEGEWGVWEGI